VYPVFKQLNVNTFSERIPTRCYRKKNFKDE